MREGKLKAVILGLEREGGLLAEAASKIDCIEIAAVADKDGNIAEKFAKRFECAAYDDYRQLVMETDTRLQGEENRCLLVAADMHTCEEYVRVAMKKKFNVLKFPPVARDFEEAAEYVRLAKEEGIKGPQLLLLFPRL